MRPRLVSRQRIVIFLCVIRQVLLPLLFSERCQTRGIGPVQNTIKLRLCRGTGRYRKGTRRKLTTAGPRPAWCLWTTTTVLPLEQFLPWTSDSLAMTLAASDGDLRSSVESIDTEDVLLPLLARLGINVDLGVSNPEVDAASRASDRDDGDDGDVAKGGGDEGGESDESDELVYIVDRFGCVVIDDDEDDDDEDNEDNEDNNDNWRITSSTDWQGYAPASCSSESVVYLHKMPEEQRQALAMDMYRKYNSLIFDAALPQDMDVSWNKKLTSTAGLTHYKRLIDRETSLAIYTCRIELATKVVDTSFKLERTLIHEMCHCAAWMIDHVAKPPHGDVFKKYATRAMVLAPGVNVSTCHNYSIFYPHRWQCGTCYQEYGRHSKSIDVRKKVCGACRGHLVYLGRFVRSHDGQVSPAKARSPQKNVSAYSTFVKTHFHRVKQTMEEEVQGSMPSKVLASDVMKKLALEWATTDITRFKS